MKITAFVASFALSLPIVAWAQTQAAADRTIEDAATSSYNYRALLQNNVKVSVHHGVVTITGTVAEHDQKLLAEETLRHIPGVTRIENRVMVEPSLATVPDNRISADVRNTLSLRPGVFAPNLRVEVRDGVVTLTGTVESETQRQLAESYARELPDVKSVRNEIMVDAVLARSAERREAAPTVALPPPAISPDAALHARIKAELVYNRRTNDLDLKIKTNDAQVTIRGVAPTEEDKALVTRVVEQVPGVKAVINEMRVRAPGDDREQAP